MTPRTVALLAVVGGVLGLTTAVALLASKTNAAPSPGPKACPAPTPGTVTGRAPQTLVAGMAQTGTSLALQVGDVLRVNLLRSSGQWSVTADDATVLQVDRVTMGPDTSAPGGTDDVVFLRAIGPGATRVSGTGGGSFHIDVTVTCG